MSRRILTALAAAIWLPFVPVEATTPLESLSHSPDVTVDLGSAIVEDENIADDDLAGTVVVHGVGTIPHETDLDAYHRMPNGQQLLSFDTTVQLPGGLIARPGDVVRFDAATYVLAFDAAARGIPKDVNVDAIAMYGSLLLLSFDVSVQLGGLQVDDEDLVIFDGNSFTLFFDGSAAGVAPGLDLDAVDYLDCSDHLLLSFDGSGAIGALSFDDEDLLEYDRGVGWELAYDADLNDPAWRSADLDAADAQVDLGTGSPVVFNQTLVAGANKQSFVWPLPVAFRAVRGSFITSSGVGAYAVNFITAGSGTQFSDPSVPSAATGFWYVVKRGGCIPSSWQSTIGAEPGRDVTVP